jgi:hypothetical protein
VVNQARVLAAELEYSKLALNSETKFAQVPKLVFPASMNLAV